MHAPTAQEIARAHRLLDELDLTVNAMNAALATNNQLLPVLRRREAIKGWLYTANAYGMVRLTLDQAARGGVA